jgi:alpha-tubulin suppressor-like RCC1 family protein
MASSTNRRLNVGVVLAVCALLGLLALGALGSPRVVAADDVQPAPLPDLPRVTAMTGGLNHWCLLGEDGSVWCWGVNTDGQLGNGTTDNSYDVPVRVEGLPGGVHQVVAFLFSTCALTDTGSVWCWGNNDEGQLGDGTTEARSRPVQVVGLDHGVTQLASEGTAYGMCAIREGGAGVCWGNNFSGRLGDGTEENHVGATPVSVVDAPLKDIVGAGGATCAVTEAGRVRCWGLLWGTDTAWNTEDGVGSWDDAYERDLLNGPITPTGLGEGVAALAAGWDVVCALKTDGSVLCWQWNIIGAGDQPPIWQVDIKPTLVEGLPAGIQAIAVSQFSEQPWGCALAGGQAWCWGDNESGQLGDGTLVDRARPVAVQTAGIAQLAIESTPVLALLRDGSLLAWGDTTPPGPHSPFAGAPMPTESSAYRDPGPLEPPITTHIPTPADISTDPPVVGANLLLAALAMIAFTIAIELLNRSIAAQEGLVRRWLAALAAAGRVRERMSAGLAGRLGTGRNSRLIYGAKIVAIVLFYGVLFAFLDPTWNPLSLTGLALVVLMALAVGLIGLSDDVASWALARRYGAAEELSVRTGGVLIALASVVATRVLVLVPGVIIGAPEALEMDQTRLDRRRLGMVAVGGLGTILAVGGVAWLGTLVTTLVRSGDGGGVDTLVGGVEALLLLVFAVAVQNAFVQLLAFRGTAGRALLSSHRVVWGVALLGVTFAFWHTLVNPRGDLATALGTTNVQAFLATVGVVLAVAIVVWLATIAANRNASGRISPPQTPPTLPTAGAGVHP